MKVLHERCAGLDVHKELVVACARLQRGAKVERKQGRFETTTKGLLELEAWLTEHGCTHVAMEATGVYWKPVWHVLEGHGSSPDLCVDGITRGAPQLSFMRPDRWSIR